MPNVNCCVPYCCADSKRHRGLRFYTLPKDRERRQAWIILIRNINLRTTSRYTSVCSLHFPGGSKTYDTKDPSIFPWSPQWPVIVQEYNNRQKICQNDLDTDGKKNRPMTLRIPPMCPWASQFNDVNSSKNVHDFYSPKTLQIDNDLQEITSNAATNDFFTTIEAECLQPLEPNRSPAHENKPDISLSIEDKSNFSSTITNKNLNSLDFYGPSPLSSEFLMQSSMNNNELHSTLFSSTTENQINHELAQTEAEIRRRTYLMSEHYNRKTRREVQKDMLASSMCSQTFQMNSQAHPSDDFHQNLQIQAKKNLPTGERSVAKTIRKAVDTPTHSYVIHKHQGSMLSNMADLWKKGKLCDATIGNGTMKIMVHKIVLVALSPQLLSLPNTDLTSGCFQLTFPQEIGGDALWAFAKYMYEGVVSLNVDVLEDMERISKILNLQDLQDMCNLYRNQVNLPNTTSLSQSPIVNNSSTTDIAINLDTLQPSVTSASTSSGVSFFSLPSGDITQTVSRPVQHLQILSTGSNDHQFPYSSNQSPTPGMKLSPEERSCVTISPSDSDSDYTIVTNNVKQEPSSPVSMTRYQEKDFLSSLPSRQSQTQVFVRDDLSEPWQPRSYCESDDVTSPSPPKQLKLTDELESIDNQSFKIESGGLNHKVNDAPYPISLVPAKDLDVT